MSQPTALVADDSEEMRLLLTKTLETLGVNVVSQLENGEKAFEKICEMKPQMCFLDIDMPKMTGIEILDELRNVPFSTYPVIISGHNTAVNVKTAISKGAKGFIVKPYTFEKIKQIIERFIDSQ